MRRKTILAVLALLLTGTALGESARADGGSQSEKPTDEAPEALRAVFEKIERNGPDFSELLAPHLRGYALAEQLDEIARLPEIERFFMQCAEAVQAMSPADLHWARSEAQLMMLFPPSLLDKVSRLTDILDVFFDITPVLVEQPDAREQLDDPERSFDVLFERMEDYSRPVDERRMICHAIRGMSAWFCLGAGDGSIELQGELLDHALVGYESMLRLIGERLDEDAQRRICALGLTLVSKESFDNEAEELKEALENLQEARSFEPDFSLPPHPGFNEDWED